MSYVWKTFETRLEDILNCMCGNPVPYINRGENRWCVYRILKHNEDELYEAVVTPIVKDIVAVEVIAKTHFFKISVLNTNVPIHCIDSAINKMLRLMYEKVEGKMSSPSTKMLPYKEQITSYIRDKDLIRF